VALRESGLLKRIIRYRGSGQKIGVGDRDVFRGITRAFVRAGIGVRATGLLELSGKCIPNNCPLPVAQRSRHLPAPSAQRPVVITRTIVRQLVQPQQFAIHNFFYLFC
jgi:hypothetical protein